MKIILNVFLWLKLFMLTVGSSSAIGFRLEDFVISVLNDVLYLNKTQYPINKDCSEKLKLWYNSLISLNPDSWSRLGIF